ncbi:MULTISPECIES: ImmA/IrrE family metallo-endopeptidase [Myroides]|uniref:ImmA/IrrE family metallo-endopeptidase n=1 Tax=Myroides TaxID=76831 RepID=UPI00132805B8|nr:MULTISPECIES: hypothetical protein [Myroides]MVX35236.1 hypothetical protein [Myroides sp. LoEW2-1]UVD79320.1 hypothetical protein NWE55_14480 [Myroides albus]
MRIVKGNFKDDRYQGLSIAEMLSGYIEENNLSELGLATILDINRKTLRSILEGEDMKMSIAIKISKLLNISQDTLVHSFERQVKEESGAYFDFTTKVSFLLEHFDLAELKANKVISSTTDYSTIDKELCTYFGYNHITEYGDQSIKTPLFSKSKMSVRPSKEQKAQDFWIKSNLLSFSRIDNPNEYNRELLIEFLKRIKTLTNDVKDGFSQAQYVLFQLGITVIVQSYLSKTKAFGVSMIVNDKPCIVITDMGKQYYKLWFTLLHELYHVLEDYDYLKTASYHISDMENKDLFVSEDNADAFAREVFVSKDKMPMLQQLINNPIKINKLAKGLDMHPSMLYGVYLDCADRATQTRDFPRFAKYLPNSAAAIKPIIFDAIGKKSIDAAVQEMKKKLNILTA